MILILVTLRHDIEETARAVSGAPDDCKDKGTCRLLTVSNINSDATEFDINPDLSGNSQ